MGKRILAGLFILGLLAGLPWGALAEDTVYSTDLLSISLPDDFVAFTRDDFEAGGNADSSPYRLLTFFDWYPDVWLAAHHEALDFNLLVEILRTDSADINGLSDYLIETLLLPTIAEDFAAQGAQSIGQGHVRISERTYVYTQASYPNDGGANCSYVYYTTAAKGGDLYRVTIKLETYGKEITSDMVDCLKRVISGITYFADEPAAAAQSLSASHSESGYTMSLVLPAGWEEYPDGAVANQIDKCWFYVSDDRVFVLNYTSSDDLWYYLTRAQREQYGSRENLTLEEENQVLSASLTLMLDFGYSYGSGVNNGIYYLRFFEDVMGETVGLGDHVVSIIQFFALQHGTSHIFTFFVPSFDDEDMDYLTSIMDTVSYALE